MLTCKKRQDNKWAMVGLKDKNTYTRNGLEQNHKTLSYLTETFWYAVRWVVGIALKII